MEGLSSMPLRERNTNVDSSLLQDSTGCSFVKGESGDMTMDMDEISQLEASEGSLLLEAVFSASAKDVSLEDLGKRRVDEAIEEDAANKRQRGPGEEEDEEDMQAGEGSEGRQGPHSLQVLSDAMSTKVAITTSNGRRISFKRRSPDEPVSKEPLVMGGRRLGEHWSESKLGQEVDELNAKMENKKASDVAEAASRAEQGEDERPRHLPGSGKLWVDKYAPRSFLHLLSDERTNRSVLQWIKSWDKVVFGRAYQPPTGGHHSAMIDERALDGKVLLLHGPPGLGKTTLAHILAKTAGYCAAEINASDERSGAGLKMRLESLMEMKAMMGDARPNCVILDEIDGTTGSEGAGAIDVLLKLCANDARGTHGAGSNGGGRSGGKVGELGGMDDRRDDDEDEKGEGKEEDGDEDMGDTAPKQGGKGKGKAKKQAAKPKRLNRPIICICNDLYAPALRALRNVAFVVKFTPPSEQKLVARLAQIASTEKLSVDRPALALLYEMHAGDIRSCINALQMISTSSSSKQITIKNLRAVAGGTRDNGMSTGLFDVWTTVFAVKPPGSGYGKDRQATAPYRKQHDVRQLLTAHSSSIGLVINGCFHNFPKSRYTDPWMMKTCKAVDAMAESDLLDGFIKKGQNWALMPYLSQAVVTVHLSCQSPQTIQIEYPRALSEMTQLQRHNKSLISAAMTAVMPALRPHYTPNLITLQSAPFVRLILEPTIKLAHMHLMAAEDRKALEDQVTIMASLGLTYKYSSKDHGKPMLCLEPRVDDLVRIPKDAPRVAAAMTQDVMKHVQKMLELHAIKKTHEAQNLVTPDKAAAKAIHQTPAPLAKKVLPPPSLPSKSLTFGQAGWASASQHAATRGHMSGCTNTFPTRFVFHEGITNAIKRPVYMKDLLF